MNKEMTIKNASDEELNNLLSRLSKEYDIQRLIRDIRRLSTPQELREFMDQSVSTEVPIQDLYHYGVKGMRWGKRKGKTTTADQKTKRSRKKASKSRRTLTDKDIKKRIARLESEKKLKSLTEEDVSPGKALAKRILAKSGEKALSTMATGVMLYATKAAMEQKFDLSEAAKYVAPKPKNK